MLGLLSTARVYICGGKSSGGFGFNARSNVAYGTFRPHLRPSPDVNFVALLIYYAPKKVNSSFSNLMSLWKICAHRSCSTWCPSGAGLCTTRVNTQRKKWLHFVLCLVEMSMKAGTWGEGPCPFARHLCPISRLPALLWATNLPPNSIKSLSPADHFQWLLLHHWLKFPLLNCKESHPGEGWELYLVTVQLWHHSSRRRAPHPSLPEELFTPGQFNTAGPAPPPEEDRRGRGAHTDTLLLPKWWWIHRRSIAPFPQKSFTTTPRKPRARPTCGWELCLQGGKDGDPPPLHLARPDSAGCGGHRREEEEAPPRAVLACGRHRKRLTSYEGFRSPPAGFLCLHSLRGLGFAFLVLMFGVSFGVVIHPFPLCKMVFSELGFFSTLSDGS